MKNPRYQQTRFLKSVMDPEFLPKDDGFEVALVGRSNAGKSSALNAITNQHKLAKTSKLPGRTQCINVFPMDDDHRFIDLPGYGFAQVPLEMKKKWEKLASTYLQSRQSLKGILLMMDIRHPLKPGDITLLTWARETGVPVHTLLTKCDKLTYQEKLKTLKYVEKELESFSDNFTCQVFSSKTHEGMDDVHTVLDHWYHYA